MSPTPQPALLEAVVGKSRGYWLSSDDFVSTESDAVDPRRLGVLCFPRDWPAVYSQSAVLKSLIGKKGRLAGKRVAVAGLPAPEERAQVQGLTFHPLQSFANAEQAAEQAAGLVVVRGWAVFERSDRPAGAVFVAERYWWNALPSGKWVDLTPRPESWQNILLAETVIDAAKTQSLFTAAEAEIASCLMEQRFPSLPRPIAARPASTTASSAPVKAVPAASKPKAEAKPKAKQGGDKNDNKARVVLSADQVAAPLDYSKWSCIVDSDDEGGDVAASAPAATAKSNDYGVKDLEEGKQSRRPLPVPDYLIGDTGGGGGTNCYLSICKLLDADLKKKDNDKNTHQLAQAFGKIFHCGLMDKKRQSFYSNALASVSPDAFVIVIGLGSIIPMLHVARRGANRGMLLEMSTKLGKAAEDILNANNAPMPVAVVKEGLDKEEPILKAVAEHLPADAKEVVVLTERFAHDLLSNGIVPSSVAVHAAVCARAKRAKVSHIPKTVELMATPVEIRSEKLGDFDLRPFNAFRHTTSNDKADFWWWAVRLDNQENTRVALLGTSQTLCGFDFDRSPEITLDEVRRSLKLEITARGRCNGIAMWWNARHGDLLYTTEPRLAGGVAAAESDGLPCRSEWKQPVHYLAGETAVFVGDTLEVLVSITPRFTVRMMQQSPFSVEAPTWIKAPTQAKFSATMPLLPYHFLMMTDLERLRVYGNAIRAAVAQQKERLGRRPRVLDCGCGIGALGMIAALEGADVWLCEAVSMMRQMCREVLAVNASAIAEKRGLVQLLPPMLSSRLQVGEDVEEKFDIIVSEVMDLWCLGEGVIPTMRHAHNKLLAEGGVMLPSRLVIFAQPLELLMWGQAERDNKVNLSALNQHFHSKFSPMRIDQFPHRWLADEAIPALEIDLKNVPQQPADGEPNLEGVNLCIRMGGKPGLQARIRSTTIDHGGMLCGYGVWWAADLNNGHLVTSAPSSPQRSWKQLVRWLDEPRWVSEGEDVQVLACFNENQVNVEDIFMPRELVEQYQEQLTAESQQQPNQDVAVANAVAASRKARSPAPVPNGQTHPTEPRPSALAEEDDDDDVVEVD